MRIPRIYTTRALSCDTLVDLDESSSRRLTSALRMSAGQAVILFDGKGGEYSGELTNVQKNRVSVSISAFIDCAHPPLRYIPIWAIGLCHVVRRMDFAIQKATELGVRCNHTTFHVVVVRLNLTHHRLAKLNVSPIGNISLSVPVSKVAV